MKKLFNCSEIVLFTLMAILLPKTALSAQNNPLKMTDYYTSIQNEHTKFGGRSGVKVDKNSVCMAFCSNGYVVNSLIVNNDYSGIEKGQEVLFTEINIQKGMKSLVPNGYYKVRLYKKENLWYSDFIDMTGKLIKTLQVDSSSQNFDIQQIKWPSVHYAEGKITLDFTKFDIVIGIVIH